MTEEDGNDVVISYETLFELFRREKGRDDIQELPKDFVENTKEFVLDIRQQLKNMQREVSSFQGEDLKKLQKKLESIQSVLKELYQKRERKIITMALTKSRTDANLLDVAKLLDTEKDMFNSLVKVLNYHRESFMASLTSKKQPEMPLPAVVSSGEDKGDEKAVSAAPKNMMIRFIEPVPKFLDNGMNVLGPFDADEVANLPLKIAELLIAKGKAQEIKSR